MGIKEPAHASWKALKASCLETALFLRPTFLVIFFLLFFHSYGGIADGAGSPGPISPILPGAGGVLSHSASSQGFCLSLGFFFRDFFETSLVSDCLCHCLRDSEIHITSDMFTGRVQAPGVAQTLLCTGWCP